MFKIGNIEIKNKVILAPMAGVCNIAYRKIIKEMGAGLVYSEMISAEALVRDNQKTLDMLQMCDEEQPLAVQLFGGDVEVMTQAAIKLTTLFPNLAIIDINMGCPVPKVAQRAAAGSALLKDKDKVFNMVSSIVKNVNVPVTVKIRSGWDEEHINAVEIAQIIQKAGASAIAVHPRTRSQGYTGFADWNIIKEVKKNVNIPVIGNGDIKNGLDAKKMLDETGCDAVMIGRGVLGNPWLIKEIINFLEEKTNLDSPLLTDRILMIKKHFDYLIKYKIEKVALLEIRTHIGWYLKGYKKYNNYKVQFYKITTKEEFYSVYESLKKEIENS